MTNFEKINSMSVEEMAEFINNLSARCITSDCDNCPLQENNQDITRCVDCDDSTILKWLENEVEE
jgi:hypothetical protein